MTIIPEKFTPLAARTSADFEQEFELFQDEAQTTPYDLTGWTFRFVAKKDALDTTDWLVAQGGAVTVTPLAGRVVAKIERDVLTAALAAGVKRQDGEWELQATGPSDLDGVWAAGKFTLVRGL
jgi:hypothetical protein